MVGGWPDIGSGCHRVSRSLTLGLAVGGSPRERICVGLSTTPSRRAIWLMVHPCLYDSRMKKILQSSIAAPRVHGFAGEEFYSAGIDGYHHAAGRRNGGQLDRERRPWRSRGCSRRVPSLPAGTAGRGYPTRGQDIQEIRSAAGRLWAQSGLPAGMLYCIALT